MDAAADQSSLASLLRPRSVAVIGASARPGFAATAFQNLVRFGFAGPVYPVNPGYTELSGLRCYPSVDAVPGPVDLALIVVSAGAVPGVMEQCAAKGVGAVVVYASGFAESGERGRRLQDRVTEIAANSGMRVLGPNCMGMFNQSSRLVGSFSNALREGLLPPSDVAYVGQSGAIGGAVLGMVTERGFGLSAWFSTGNEADLGSAEIVAELLEQDDIQVIATYLETVPDGVLWRRVTARAAELGKHVVLLRSGRSDAGRRAAASHTGAMIRPDEAFSLLNAEFGVIEVDDAEELADTVAALAGCFPPAGPSLAVVTSSGGAGGILADRLEHTGLALAELRPRTKAALAELVPEYGSVANPVDVTAQLFGQGEDAFVAACVPLLEDDGVDILSILLTTLTGDAAVAVAKGIVRLAAHTAKPIAVVWMAALGDTWEARRILHRGGVPVTSSMTAHVRVLRNLRVQPSAAAPAAPVAARHVLPDGLLDEIACSGAVLTEAAGQPLLDALGIAHSGGILATTAQQAVEAARALGEPLVFKVQSPQIPHKSEVGGVRVGVRAEQAAAAYEDVRAAGRRVPGARVDGVLVQRMASPGVELIVGVQGARDGYPPVLTLGMGGVATEIYADVVTALAPVSHAEAHALLRRLRGWPLLDGYRARPRVAVDAVVDVIVSLSKLGAQLGSRLDELEINPLIVDEHRAVAVDLLLRTRIGQDV